MEGFNDAMIAFDAMEPYTVNSISFNLSLFNAVSQFMAFYNSKDNLPTEELIRATGLDRVLQSDNRVMFNIFGIRYMVNRIQNLQSPYKTMCRNAKYRDQYLKCVNGSVVSEFNRLSYMSQRANGSLKLMSNPLLQNISNAQKYFDIVKYCRDMFHWNDCDTSVFASSNDEQILWNSFKVYALLPHQFDIFIGTRARLVILDYMTLCFSCFGTWLGISVLGLNPFKWQVVQPLSLVEAVTRSRLRPLYQTIRLVVETVKQQQEFNLQLDQELQTVRNEVKKLARKRSR